MKPPKTPAGLIMRGLDEAADPMSAAEAMDLIEEIDREHVAMFREAIRLPKRGERVDLSERIERRRTALALALDALRRR